MRRITGPTAVDLGGGRPGFIDENLLAGIEGTDVTAEWLNSVQEEILGPIEAAGLGPDAGDWAQLRKALSRLFGGGLRTVTANTALTADDAGLVLVDASGGSRTYALPLASAANGRPLRVALVRTDSSGNAVNIQRAGADTIEGAVNLPLRVGDRITLLSDGVSAWRVVADAPQRRTLANPGLIPLPGGFLLQWRSRTLTINGGTSLTVTLPQAMPTDIVAVLTTIETSVAGGGEATVGWEYLSNSQFFLRNSSPSTAFAVTWVALGY
jgi:hypothetical protein